MPRAVAVRLGVSWVELLREADALLGEADAADCVGWVLGRWAGFDNRALSSGPSRGVRGAAASAAGLRRVSPAVGLQLVVGVSGLLSPHEGDMAVRAAQRLSLCWAGAAPPGFRAADWWSLAWGAEPLGALATVVRGGGDGARPRPRGARRLGALLRAQRRRPRPCSPSSCARACGAGR